MKFKALIDFKGIKEEKNFKKGDEIELTEKRANEICENIKNNFNINEVLEKVVEEKPKKQTKKPVDAVE